MNYYSSFQILFVIPLALGVILYTFHKLVVLLKRKLLYECDYPGYVCQKTAMFAKLRMTGVLLILSEAGEAAAQPAWATAAYRIACCCCCWCKSRQRSMGTRVASAADSLSNNQLSTTPGPAGSRPWSPGNFGDATSPTGSSLPSPSPRVTPHTAPVATRRPAQPDKSKSARRMMSNLSAHSRNSKGMHDSGMRRLSIDDSKAMVGHDRLTALALLASHGTRPMRIWFSLNAVRDWHGMFGDSGGICHCIPRDPCAQAPHMYQLCRKGLRQWYLMSFRARVRNAIAVG